MPENKKVFFIVNKFSGTNRKDSLEEHINSGCERHHVTGKIEYTAERGHATVLARQAVKERFDQVFAVGGDGTVNEVAKGLIHTGMPMGIIPTGSGNGLARHLHIPLDLRSALALTASSSTIDMDTIMINGQLSVNVSGIGFDGHVAWLFGKNGRRGLVGYATLVLKEFMSFPEIEAEIDIDGHVFTDKNFILAVANSSQFGNNATIAPYASVCDRELDLCLVKKVPLHSAIGFARQMFSGKLNKSKYVSIRKGKNVTIRLARPVAFHVDGEPHEPAAGFKAHIQPGGLKMIVPPRGSGLY